MATAAAPRRCLRSVVDRDRRRLLDNLLAASLYRALALAQVDRCAVPVGEHLHFDVAHGVEVALQVEAVVAEAGLRLLRRYPQRSARVDGILNQPDALAAAAGRGFDQQGKANPGREVERVFWADAARAARH